MSQNAAHDSVDSSMLTAEMSVEQQQQQQQHDEPVKRTVGRVLSRLGLLQLTSLIDTTVINQPDTDSIQVRVIRSTQSRVDGSDDELRQVGESFALLLQLLRRCTNWNELVSADISLSDALTRLTEHEFTGGTMGYGVHTERAVEHLASMLTATRSCAAVASSDTVVVDSCQQQTVPNMPQHISMLSQLIDVEVEQITVIQDEVCARFGDKDKAVGGQLKHLETSSVDMDTPSVEETSSVDVDTQLVRETTDSPAAKTDDSGMSHELHLRSDNCQHDVATSLTSHSHHVHKHCQSDELDQACDNDASQHHLVDNCHNSDNESPLNSDAATAAQYYHDDN